ncbi:MAG: TraB/GumN family protein [Pseudomonadota bacterium]|nr:MAG: TraB/GumN family protein [Pseudomonadota bacterium]
MMRLTRQLRLIAAVALCVLPGAWVLQQAYAAPTAQVGILWEVSSAGKPTSYLMGTVHSDDPRVLDLPGTVRDAFAGADSFTAEIDMTPQAMVTISGAMFFQDQTELSKVIGKDLYAKCTRLLAEYGLPEPVVRKIKPWAVVVTLSTPKSTSGLFLDQVLYTQFVAGGKPVYGLETVEEQVNYFDGLPMRHQVSMLRETVRHHKDYSHLTEQMINAWLDRDLSALERLNDD